MTAISYLIAVVVAHPAAEIQRPAAPGRRPFSYVSHYVFREPDGPGAGGPRPSGATSDRCCLQAGRERLTELTGRPATWPPEPRPAMLLQGKAQLACAGRRIRHLRPVQIAT